jgi:chemotaxis protein MotB
VKNQKPIIIKRVRKRRDEGSHGSAWKVAYADFVTAMMAFFLLLWLLSMVSDEKRARLAAYFKNFSLHTESGVSFMGKSSELFADAGESKQKAFRDKYSRKDSISAEGRDNRTSVTLGVQTESQVDEENLAELEDMEEALRKDISDELEDMKDQVLVDMVDEGVKIQMIDQEGREMFELGSTRLTPIAKKIFRVIGKNINNLPNKINVDGHTDALPYAGNDYSNWELSTERASSARRELEANGLNARRIARVSGFAATDPLIKENPNDSRNRRISMVLKFQIIDEEITEEKESEKKSPVKSKSYLEIPDIKKIVKKHAIQKEEEENAIKNSEGNLNHATNSKDNPDIKESVDNGEWSPVTDNPVITDNWNPVMIMDDNNSLENDDWGLVINRSNNNDRGLLPKGSDTPPLKKGADTPANKKISSAVIEDIRNTVTRVNKKLDATKNNKEAPAPEAGKSDEKPQMIKELSNPVISNDQWSPVVNNPVINNDRGLLPKGSDTPPSKKGVDTPANKKISSAVIEDIRDTVTRVNKKLDATKKNKEAPAPEAGKSDDKPQIIEEFSNPVISKDQLSPVLDKR